MTRLRPENFRYARRINSNGEIGFNLFIVGVITTIIIAISAAVYAGYWDSANTTADARSALNHTVNAKPSADAHRDTARNILQLYKQGLVDVLETPAYDEDDVAKLQSDLKHVVRTGDSLHLSVHHATWHNYGHWVVPIEILLGLLGMMLVGFVRYSSESDYHDEYLMDLPWRKPWPYFFVAATALPIGWIFYMVSLVRYLHALRTQERPTPRDYDDPFGYRRDMFIHYEHDEEEQETAPPKKPKFNHVPAAARQTYHQLRTTGWGQYVGRRTAELQQSLAYVESDLRDLGQELRHKQRERQGILANIQRLESAEAVDRQLDSGQLDSEFDQILAMPGVSKVRVINDELSILLLASITYEGVKYDLGDWEIRVGLRDRIYTHRLRSGTKNSWHGGYPEYLLSDDAFCFNARQRDIDEHLRKGQLLEAVELAVNTMQSVNDNDMPSIPKAFRKDKRNDDN